jgi:hypothetical protein
VNLYKLFGGIMPTAILSTDNESDFNLIIELSKKLNLNTKILTEHDENKNFYKLSENSFDDWLVKEEEEAWKDL